MEMQQMEASSPPYSAPLRHTQKGDRNTHVAHAQNVVINNHTCPFLSNPLSFLWQRMHRPESATVNVDNRYYNLIVVQHGIRNNRLTIHRNRVLQGDSEIVQQLSSLDDEAIARLKTFPSLIMHENKDYGGRATPDQEANYGFITGIRVQENGYIRIRFHTVAKINQQAINDIATALDIHVKRGVMELNETHLTVKPVDLTGELLDAELLTENQLIGEEEHNCQKNQKNGQASWKYPSTSA